MLIALFTILLLGGSATGMLDFIADTQDTVKVVMEKDDRRKEVLATLKETKKRTNAYNKMVKSSSKDIKKILSNDEIADGEIDTIWEGYFASRADYISSLPVVTKLFAFRMVRSFMRRALSRKKRLVKSFTALVSLTAKPCRERVNLHMVICLLARSWLTRM